MKKPTVIVYVRLSRDSDASTSVASQEAACRAYADQRGWNVLFVAEDVDVSGASKLESRPGMSRVLDGLASADYLLAARLDRFSRSVLEFALLSEMATNAGATLITADGTLGPESSRLMTNIMAAFADFELETIKTRIRNSKNHLRSVGRWLGGQAPFGYRLVKREGGTYLDIDPESAAVVRDCADKILHHGASLTGLTRELNDAGVPSPADHARRRDGRPERGTKWSSTTLRDVLITPAVRGWLIQAAPGKARTALNHVPVLDAAGEPHRVGPELMDAETYVTLRDLLDARAKGRGSDRTGRSLLLHVAVCSECGGWLYHQSRSVNGRDFSTYLCSKGVGRHGQHASNVVQARGLNAQAEAEFLDRWGGFSLMHKVRSAGRDVARELRETDEALDNLSGNLVSLPPGGRAAQAVIAQIEALETKRATLVQEAATPVRAAWVDSGRTIAEEWEARTTDGRNAMLREFGTVVTVSPLPRTAERRFSVDRAKVVFEGPEWVREADPYDARMAEIELEERLADEEATR